MLWVPVASTEIYYTSAENDGLGHFRRSPNSLRYEKACTCNTSKTRAIPEKLHMENDKYQLT